MICIKRTYFECVIPERNKRAFYELIAGQDLFGYVVIRGWGRIGSRGNPRKQHRFIQEIDMTNEYERVHKERIKRNYVPISKGEFNDNHGKSIRRGSHKVS